MKVPSIGKSTHADVTNLHELDTSSFAGAEMRSGNEKPAGNTLCIAKGFEAAWAYFCPAKPCVSLTVEGKIKKEVTPDRSSHFLRSGVTSANS